ncbi:MAG TPA: hypothetical protein VHM25_23890 [Polyangiaceae bacterium]|jgi:hypothetical protein|nr:hypothetical protein [Polyangiaceae bacterium]
MSQTHPSTQTQVRLLRTESSHGIALSGRTLVVLWQTDTSREAVRELASLLAGHAAEMGNVGLLQVIGEGATSPDGDVRAALAAMLKENEARIVASAVVFEGTGFRASVIRSIVVGISMLSRPKCPHVVFASVNEGTAWLSSRLGGSDAARHAVGMQLAIDRLRGATRK